MIPCDDCATARDWTEFNRFNPACVYCGARYWRNLAIWCLGAHDLSIRRRAVVDTWKKFEHDMVKMRALALGTAVPIEPETEPPKAKARKR